MIGHFLTPMADKGARGHRNINTNQPARSEAKSTEDFHHLLFQQESSSFAMEIPKTDAVDKDARIAIVFPGLLFVQSDFCILQSFRSSVVVFKASSCILRHHSYSVFFRRLDNSPTHDSNVSALKKSASSSRDLQDMRFAEWLPFPLSSYLPLKSSSPALALYTLFCFSEAEINIARLLLPAPIMGAWLQIVVYFNQLNPLILLLTSVLVLRRIPL